MLQHGAATNDQASQTPAQHVTCGTEQSQCSNALPAHDEIDECVQQEMENHAHAIALHFLYYNFVRIHQAIKVTPAMAARVTKRLWEIGDIVDMLEAWEVV